jgi:hypothetical protein
MANRIPEPSAYEPQMERIEAAKEREHQTQLEYWALVKSGTPTIE